MLSKLNSKTSSVFPGELLKDAFDFTNYAYFDSLPIEFLYLDSLCNVTGGFVTYYLATYGLVTRFNQKSQWATRLAAFDGVESTMVLIGTLLAPLIFEKVQTYKATNAGQRNGAIFPFTHLMTLPGVVLRSLYHTCMFDHSWHPLDIARCQRVSSGLRCYHRRIRATR